MKKLLAALLLLPLLSVTPSQAASRCYSASELRAERLIRLHSELMVITVTCKQSSTGRDLVKAYTGFTRQNISAIKQAEKTMTSYYASAYGGDGISRLDTLRTKLANAFGQQVADESAPSFCARRRDRVISMYDSPPRSLYDESARLYPASLSNEDVCDGAQKEAISGGNEQETASSEEAIKPKKVKKKAKS